MKPYAELLEFNQPNPIRKEGFTRIRDSFPGLRDYHQKFDSHYHNIGVFFDPERIAEFAGRWDYGPKNADRLGTPAKDGTPIIRKWLASGEQSMIEMGHATFFVECSRVVSHELVRHRLLSFQQESQRFTKYDELDYYVPSELPDEWGPGKGLWDDDVSIMGSYQAYCQDSFSIYEELIKRGVPKQIARYVLPNATSTRLIVSGNIREWRHVIKLRLHSSAQPEMRELMQQIYDQLIEVFPQSLEGVLEEGRGVR